EAKGPSPAHARFEVRTSIDRLEGMDPRFDDERAIAVVIYRALRAAMPYVHGRPGEAQKNDIPLPYVRVERARWGRDQGASSESWCPRPPRDAGELYEDELEDQRDENKALQGHGIEPSGRPRPRSRRWRLTVVGTVTIGERPTDEKMKAVD